MIDDPKNDGATPSDEANPADEAEEMEKVQKDAAEERENEGGYQ